MCGIAGIVTVQNTVRERLLNAEAVQRHRGPDAQGLIVKTVSSWHVGLGHQRLSILDLSVAGNQPMSSPDGRGWIIFNGEIYNYREIRTELAKHGWEFKSDSDTEVLLAALRHWGLDDALSRLNGMWAFAWLDLVQNRLVLARDRAGVKPLHVCLENGELLFASEMKTILSMAGRKFALDHQIIGEYLLQSVQESGERTFFAGISKLPAAHYTVIDLKADRLELEVRRYWSIPKQAQSFPSEDELSTHIRELFFDAVKLRLRSDVPVGVLLSGGIDSSSIAAAMQAVLGKGAELNLLSAVSDDPRFDESPFIDIMGRHLNRKVHKVRLDFEPDKAFDYLEEVCWFNDEPVGSFSNIAHFLLMKKARELGITVILSGQGSDELTCGYLKYLGFYVQSLISQGKLIKAAVVLGKFWQQGTVLKQFTLREAKRYIPSFLRPRVPDVRGDALNDYTPVFLGLLRGTSVQDRQALDFERFSIPTLTHTEDRMSMAWGREIRVPFLDYRLVEALLPLPSENKLHNGWTKYVFRKAMEPFLPKEITWRKDKQGFINPEEEWFKSTLQKKTKEIFYGNSMIFEKGFVHQGNMQKVYAEYCQQSALKGNVAIRDIFSPVAFELWLRKFSDYIE